MKRLICEACGWHWPLDKPASERQACIQCGATMAWTEMTADMDRACPHDEFESQVSVSRLLNGEGGQVKAYSADIQVRCARCGEKFRWVGVQAGQMPDRPMCSVDETELRAPLRPASSDPDFGMGIPGFAITIAEPEL